MNFDEKIIIENLKFEKLNLFVEVIMNAKQWENIIKIFVEMNSQIILIVFNDFDDD